MSTFTFGQFLTIFAALVCRMENDWKSYSLKEMSEKSRSRSNVRGTNEINERVRPLTHQACGLQNTHSHNFQDVCYVIRRIEGKVFSVCFGRSFDGIKSRLLRRRLF